jgi:uncharacterized membrane protein
VVEVTPSLSDAPQPKPAAGTALRVGWIAGILGLLTFWFYGIGFGLFVVALICAIVATAKGRRREGLMLLWSTLAILAGCVFVLLFLLSGSEVGPTQRDELAEPLVKPANPTGTTR